jgi:hypothetical protein
VHCKIPLGSVNFTVFDSTVSADTLDSIPMDNMEVYDSSRFILGDRMKINGHADIANIYPGVQRVPKDKFPEASDIDLWGGVFFYASTQNRAIVYLMLHQDNTAQIRLLFNRITTSPDTLQDMIKAVTEPLK